jgi:acetyl/propionyl-CoA carboxylase alpha subunit
MRGAGKPGAGGVLMRHAFSIDGAEHEAWLSRRGKAYVLHFGERAIPVSLTPADDGAMLLRLGGETIPIIVVSDGDTVHVHINGATHSVRYVDPVRRYASHADRGADDVAEAPMPGVVIAVHAAPGQRVATGETLMVIESMKLETAIRAWRAGAVAEVHVGVGQSFQRGAPLLSLAPQTEA